MSGHSKWANIKRKKGVNDAQRAAVFTKMARIVSTAVHEGGGIGDPDKNVRLRLAVDRAKAVNMPKDTIQRAIDKAAIGDGTQMKEILYEAFGHGGVAIIVASLTDNSNRTHAEVKHALEKNGGKLASPNSVAYQFEKCGIVELDKSVVSEQEAFAFSDALQALDLEEDEASYIIYIPFENMGKVKNVEPSLQTKSIDIFYRPSTTVAVSQEDREKAEALVEKLEDLDDVMNVYTNIQDEEV